MSYVPKPKVYVTREIPERGLRMIKERFDTEVWPEYAPPPKKVIIEKARNVDALASLLSDKIDAEVFDAAPKLRIVAQMAVGMPLTGIRRVVEVPRHHGRRVRSPSQVSRRSPEPGQHRRSKYPAHAPSPLFDSRGNPDDRPWVRGNATQIDTRRGRL